MIPKMKRSHFVKKYSVTFVQPDGQRSQPFYFFNRYDRETVAQTWQVLRSEFDQMMLDNAREKGAEVREETTVNQLLMDGDRVVGVECTDRKDGRTYEVRAPITLDCTGKEAFASNQRGWRMRDPYLNKVAVWTYYKGSKREPGIDEGETTVAYVPDKGWFWHIPQHNDMVSVGVVAEGKYLTPRWRAGSAARSSSARWRRTNGSRITSRTGESTGEYCDHQRIHPSLALRAPRPGLLLVGDAFAFLDPVFSSGVMLALKSGVLAGEEVHEALVARRSLAGALRAITATHIREGVENMRKLVYAFYDPEVLLQGRHQRYPEAAGEITDCLSGDVNKDFTPLWSKIREFVPLPDDLPYGVPLVA